MEYKPETGFAREVGLKSLAAKFAEIVDQRKRRGVRYPLAALLTLIMLAKLCGSDTPTEIADWVGERAEKLKRGLGLDWKRMPHHSTYRRVLAGAMKIEELEEKARQYVASLGVTVDECLESEEKAGSSQPVQTPAELSVKDLFAVDGKTLRGTIAAGETKGLHLVSICQVSPCATLGQVAVESKENEISASPRLLKQVDVNHKTISGDAMLAQKKFSKQIVRAGGDYLFTIKNNHKTLRAEIEAHFTAKRLPAFAKEEDFRTHTTIEKGHGRIEQRTLTASTGLNEYLDWPHLEQVFEIKRETIILSTGKTRSETIYGITSHRAEKADAAKLLELNRAHWGIENGSHYRRDVTFKEDHCRMKSYAAAEALAVFNNLAIALICHDGWENAAKARRHYGANIGKALRVILESPH